LTTWKKQLKCHKHQVGFFFLFHLLFFLCGWVGLTVVVFVFLNPCFLGFTEDVPLPEIKPIEGIDLDIEDTCKDKCERCLKDWKWKWVVCFLIIVAVMVLAIHLLTEEHERLDAEINARTYRLDDVDSCALHPGIAEDPWALPPVLYLDDAGRKTFEDAFHDQSGN